MPKAKDERIQKQMWIIACLNWLARMQSYLKIELEPSLNGSLIV